MPVSVNVNAPAVAGSPPSAGRVGAADALVDATATMATDALGVGMAGMNAWAHAAIPLFGLSWYGNTIRSLAILSSRH